MKTKNLKESKGITLIALVITIIVLLILAAVSIAVLTGENGILTKAQEAKNRTEQEAAREQAQIDMIIDTITESTNGEYVKEKGVNSPKLVSGMTKIMFTDPTETKEGEVIKSGEAGFNNEKWFDYKNKNWANVMTEDGSMWVWIPRFAYKINDTKTMDVKFLIGTTDQYYDEDGTVKTAKRASKDKESNTTEEYYVHPAFTNETEIEYANGGWDRELSGIWVAKFEAGYASGNNKAPVVESTQKYTETTAWVGATERGMDKDDGGIARNWLDGIYNNTTTTIKYPTFQGITYSMNYINHNDAYNIAKSLTGENNIYGFNSSTTDSHLMKDSEWGAVAYLAQSQYGLDGIDIAINNITLDSGNRKREVETGRSGVDSVYAVTGLTQGEENNDPKEITESDIKNLNNATGNTAINETYAWNQKTGEKASSTGTIYGIYDLSGGLWERTSLFVANDNNISQYGNSLFDEATKGEEIKSTPYVMVLKKGTDGKSSEENYNQADNKKIIGTAMHETSTAGSDYTSWCNDNSFMPLSGCFSIRGGFWKALNNRTSAGLFSFNSDSGWDNFILGFRAVLVAG